MTITGFVPQRIAYRIVLDQFHIDNTRAVDEDTDGVAFQGTLDGAELPKLNLSTGDVDNGDHLINLQFDPMELGGSSQLEVRFAILNSGHANEQSFRDELDTALHA